MFKGRVYVGVMFSVFVCMVQILFFFCFLSKALIQDVAQDEEQNISIFLPPCNEDADKPENVYKFEDSIFFCGRVVYHTCKPQWQWSGTWEWVLLGVNEPSLLSQPRAEICCGEICGPASAVSCLFPTESQMLCLPVGSSSTGNSSEVRRAEEMTCGLFRDIFYWPASVSCHCILLFVISLPPSLLEQEQIELISLQVVQTRRENKGTLVFFKILSVLSPAEYKALEVPAAVFVNITQEEITKKTEDKR